MNIIGKKLSNSELLLIKGGYFASYDCKCTSGSNNNHTWTGEYTTTTAMLLDIETVCGDTSNGVCEYSNTVE
ncbi:hypothetical protein ACV07N_13450 [Roseivirga echinicomitans]